MGERKLYLKSFFFLSLFLKEALSPAQRRQIKNDFRGQLPAICQSIDNLNTALSFLKALGDDPFLSLHEFMNTALQMKTTILSRKVRSRWYECLCVHACVRVCVRACIRVYMLICLRFSPHCQFELVPKRVNKIIIEEDVAGWCSQLLTCIESMVFAQSKLIIPFVVEACCY